MLITLAGMVMDSMLLQPKKALSPMWVTPSSMTTEVMLPIEFFHPRDAGAVSAMAIPPTDITPLLLSANAQVPLVQS